jgi:phosphate transport system permease protein
VWDALLGFKPVWDGIWPSVAGTFCLLFTTLVFAVPPGVGCGIFLACYATPRQKYWLRLAVDLLGGIPSIVMGLFGFVLIVWLRRTFLPRGTTCLLLSSFCLALLVLPTLAAVTCAALEAVSERFILTAAALGFSYGQTVRRFLLPAAGQGILGGVMLAMGRAAEDTAVIMLTGVVANAGLPAGLTAKFEALPFRIYYTAAQYANQQELRFGFGAALVLLCLSGSLLFCAWALQRRLERRWRGIRQ